MDAVTILASGPTDPAKGWAGPGALIAGAFVCYLIWRADLWWRQRRDPSPTDPAAPVPREIAQVTPVSSHPSQPQGESETAWYGRVEKVGGAFRRVYRSAAHIARTGESPNHSEPAELPTDPGGAAGAEDDVLLDLDAEDEVGGELADHEEDPALETREEFALRCVGEGVATPSLVAALIEHYGVSRATAYRLVERATEATRRRRVA